MGVAAVDGARGPLTVRELRAAGCSAAQVRAARACTAGALRAAGFSEADVEAVDVSESL